MDVSWWHHSFALSSQNYPNHLQNNLVKLLTLTLFTNLSKLSTTLFSDSVYFCIPLRFIKLFATFADDSINVSFPFGFFSKIIHHAFQWHHLSSLSWQFYQNYLPSLSLTPFIFAILSMSSYLWKTSNFHPSDQHIFVVLVLNGKKQ